MKNTSEKKKPFKVTNTMYHVFWCMLLVSAAVITASHFERLNSYDREKKEIAIQLEHQQATNEALRKELEYYDTDAYVESVAGEKLGLVKPDEIVFYNSEE